LGPEAVAIACLFAFRHPAHERRLAEALRAALPGVPVAPSCDALPLFREYERTSTTTAEAYLLPKVSAYGARAGAVGRRRGSAGGGSIAWVDPGGALKVGPRSAGAVPGPACYGRGGTAATVTDACVVLGWLDPTHPLADDVRLDAEAARRSLAALGMTSLHDARATASGIVAVATAVMARALKRVSV